MFSFKKKTIKPKSEKVSKDPCVNSEDALEGWCLVKRDLLEKDLIPVNVMSYECGEASMDVDELLKTIEKQRLVVDGFDEVRTRLQLELEGARNEVKGCRMELEAAKAEVKEAKAEATKCRSDMEVALAERKDKEVENKDLRTGYRVELEECKAEAKEAKAEAKAAKAEARECCRKMKIAQAERKETEVQNNQLRELYSGSQKEVEVLQHQMEALKTSCIDEKREHSLKLMDMQFTNERLTKRVQELEDEVARKQGEFSIMNTLNFDSSDPFLLDP